MFLMPSTNVLRWEPQYNLVTFTPSEKGQLEPEKSFSCFETQRKFIFIKVSTVRFYWCLFKNKYINKYALKIYFAET